jgi:tripartite-type tricarboxylate transporter receptor subunit TctC
MSKRVAAACRAACLPLAAVAQGYPTKTAKIVAPAPPGGIAITGTKRHPLLPDVRTFEELGYKGFDGVQWYGIVGPAKLPPDIVKKLNDETNCRD